MSKQCKTMLANLDGDKRVLYKKMIIESDNVQSFERKRKKETK